MQKCMVFDFRIQIANHKRILKHHITLAHKYVFCLWEKSAGTGSLPTQTIREAVTRNECKTRAAARLTSAVSGDSIKTQQRKV